MRPNVPALPTHSTSIRAAPSEARRTHHGRDEHLAGDGGDAEPQRHRAVDHDRDHRRADEHAVGRRVEHLAERRDLVVAAGHEAVDPVGGAEHGQEDGRGRLAVPAEEQPHEQRDAQEPDQRDDVGCGQDPVQTRLVPVAVHVASLRPPPKGRPRRHPGSGVCQSGAMPRFEPFRGLRYEPDLAPIAQVIAPPYDVISSTERVHLASRHQANSVLVELPEADLTGGRDRYAVASRPLPALAGGRASSPLEAEPSLYPYRMTDAVGRVHHRGHRRARPGRARRGERHPPPRADAAQAQERPARPAAGDAGQPVPHLGPLHGRRRHGDLRPDRRRAGGRRLRRRRGAPPALGPERPRRGGRRRCGGRHGAGRPGRRSPPLRDGARVPSGVPRGQRRRARALRPRDGARRRAGRGAAHRGRHPPHDQRAARRTSTSSARSRRGSTSCGPARPTTARSARWPTRTPWPS